MSAINESSPSEPLTTLIESGTIELAQAGDAPARMCVGGMTIFTSEGCAVGHVAALMVDTEDGKVTNLILSRPRQLPEYRLVPIRLIRDVVDEEVLLSLSPSVLDGLPRWHKS